MPGRLILTTVGTSAVSRDKLDALYLWSKWQDVKRGLPEASANQHQQWVEVEQESRAGILLFRDVYMSFLSGLDIDEEKGKPQNGDVNVFSAEMTSLHMMNVSADDQVALLLSDSPEGVICGLLVQAYLNRLSIPAVLKVITGLQVENFNEFYKGGLENFFKIINEFVERFPEKKSVLNVTGGFKSLIPFATYAAFAHDIELYLTFEEQPEPIVIDTNKWPNDVKAMIAPSQQVLRRNPKWLRNIRPE
jgi:hypothetical protein